jgi:hypothetical protein
MMEIILLVNAIIASQHTSPTTKLANHQSP